VAVDVLVYLLVGIALGWAWNRAEFGRAGFRRIAPSLCGFILFWPCLVAGAVIVTVLWSRIWKRTHEDDAAIAPPRRRAGSGPVPPFAGGAPEPSHPI
jgi:hypothetical protein